MNPSKDINDASLEQCLEQAEGNCTDCCLCVKECGFLQKYGSPKTIARNYDPGKTSSQAMPFECSLCGLCVALCPAGLNPSAMFREMRRESVKAGKGNFTEHDRLLRYERTGMSRRFTFYALPEGCTRVLFPGCAFSGTRPELTKRVFIALKKQDKSLGIVLDCCGRISNDLGREDFSKKMMCEMLEYLAEKGIREIIAVCPNCHDMFRKHANSLDVKSVFEALPQTGDAKAATRSAVIHDPCSTRFSNPYHEAVIKHLILKGIDVYEMSHSGKTTLCCGSGAGVTLVNPEFPDKWLKKISAEAKGRTIITSCAGCSERIGKENTCYHTLDVIFDPEAVLKRPKTSKPPFTYLNRLRLKRHFRKTISAENVRERRFMAGSPEKYGKLFIRLLILFSLIAIIAATRLTGIFYLLTPANIQAFIRESGVLAPLIYMLIYSIAPSLFLPGLPLTIAGGILFGPFWGVVYTITGATIGSSLAFLVGRYMARDWVETKLKNPRWLKLDSEVERHGWKIVAFTRLIPLFPFNLLNYAFGLTKIGFLPYVLTSFICMLPACIAYIVFSSSLPGLFQGKFPAGLVIGAVLIVLVSLTPYVYRKFIKESGNDDF
jgi:uncharacterized membrane protein YdjX (TVP38/TMEM64 family)/Fe-S oxidoreductase